MSRAFVKEQDLFEPLPDRPVSPHPNLVTSQSLALIETALACTQQQRAEAQRSGDRAALARSMRDLRYWSARRASAQLVEPHPSAAVCFGCRVEIRREDGRRQSFRIVGEDEADPAKGSISYLSPLARALLGRAVGDVVTVGASEAEIVAIA